MTPADQERVRRAAVKRAAKAARQARGMGPNTAARRRT